VDLVFIEESKEDKVVEQQHVEMNAREENVFEAKIYSSTKM
jgi:hypothetical protein